MDAHIRSFWWGHSSNGGHAVCLKAWDSICKPLSCGGLGFHRIKDFNVALLSKWGWNLINNEDSLCLSILRARYLRHLDFLEAVPKSGDSSFWKSILATKSIIKEGACLIVGDGFSIDPWKDPWVPNAVDFRPNLISEAGVDNTRVKDFILQQGIWDFGKLLNHFNREDAVKIANIILPIRPRPDKWAWMPNANGKFSSKSAYLIANKQRFSASFDIPKADWLRL
ncbi:hypothetical protein UlMin_013852 [Ulmus minor]